MIKKAFFVKVDFDLYKRLEKIRIEKNMKQKDFLTEILSNYVKEKKNNESK